MTFTEQDVEEFLDKCSYSGLLCLLALNLSLESSTPFDKDNFAKEALQISSAEYFQGFALCCKLVGIVNFTSKRGIYSVKSLNYLFSSRIKSAALNKSNGYVTWPLAIDRIEKYFSL